MITFFDAVPTEKEVSPYFSPFTARARLALLQKGVPFETQDVTYHDLRFEWTPKLGVEAATVPFIRRDDGTYLIDSFEICKWLEETYPDKPSIFLPEAALPIDLTSREYRDALRRAKKFDWDFYERNEVFELYAPYIVKLFDQETKDFWTADWRLGKGRWAEIEDKSKDLDRSIADLRTALAPLENFLSPTQLFFASPTAPGYSDFDIMGRYRMIRSTSLANTKATYESFPKLKKWVDEMHKRYEQGLRSTREKDPVE